MRILIVDDSEEVRQVTERLLTDAGYRDIVAVDSAAGAFEALALDVAATPEPIQLDLVLLDIMMPGVDGVVACARIRNDPRYSDTPIIMVTQLGDTDTLANAFIAGATDYVTKPVVRVELLARVRTALKLKFELDRRKAREEELIATVASSGDSRPWRLMDDVTGLFVGEVAEAYLKAAALFADDDISVLALAVDRIQAYRSTQGNAAAGRVMAQVAHAVRLTAATVGVVAAVYRNGVIVLVVPQYSAKEAKQLGEAVRAKIAGLKIVNVEGIAADHVTASIALVTGRVDRWTDLTGHLTRAISTVKEVAALGGDRVVAAVA